MNHNDIRYNIEKVLSILFSFLFVLIVFNAIFFNKVIQINFSPAILLIGSISVIAILIILYKITNLWYDKLKDILKKYKYLILIIIFGIQLLLARLIYAPSGWDCGLLIGNSFNMYKGLGVDTNYFSTYPNNILTLLIFKYLYVIVGLFTNVNTENYYFITIVFNIIVIDMGAIFTILTCKKLLGEKTTLLSLFFILPLIVFFPYIIVPYTDTLTLFIPIAIFYFYLKIKDNTRMKYLYIFIEGILLIGGYLLKPTCAIIGIAIIIIEMFYINIRDLKNIKNILKDIIIMALIFIIGMTTTYITYHYLKNKNLSKYITNEQYESNTITFTHFIMMGMQKSDVNGKAMYGAYNEQDVINTKSKSGKEEKQKYNIQIIKQRLEKMGVTGYLKFIYNKMNWVLSDGTFYYWQEGSQKYLPISQDKVSKIVQKYFDKDSSEYNKITANIFEILWIVILIGIICSFKNKEKNINILKLSALGIILFIIVFEGRSRYIYNYIPVFIILGTLGIKNIIYYINNKLIKKENK